MSAVSAEAVLFLNQEAFKLRIFQITYLEILQWIHFKSDKNSLLFIYISFRDIHSDKESILETEALLEEEFERELLPLDWVKKILSGEGH